jgi:resuscitation-promoting factor RpfA
VTSTIIKRAVGVGAALTLSFGIGLAGATPAEAATTVWDRVAQCESGGNWKINTGNGFYGGLQFAAGTWKAHGGTTYASQAHQATKAEQIAIARRVLAGKGPGAWPTCGRRAGLTKSNGDADRDATPATNPGASKDQKMSDSKVKIAKNRLIRSTVLAARPFTSSVATRFARSPSDTTWRAVGRAYRSSTRRRSRTLT